MIDWFHERGVRVIVWSTSVVDVGDTNYNEGYFLFSFLFFFLCFFLFREKEKREKGKKERKEREKGKRK